MDVFEVDKEESLLYDDDVLDDWGWPLSPKERADSNAYPSVFEEANEMLLASILIYALADLRKLARNGDPDLVHGVMELPVSTREIVDLVEHKRDEIVRHIGQGSADLYLTAFDNIDQIIAKLQISEGDVVQSDVVVFDDENAASELVYGIWVNSARKQIIVAFRGCTTRTDWSIAANSYQEVINNPACGPSTIGLHYGFYNYLNGGSPTKTSTILSHLRRLLEKHKDYAVYVTGHSLGGALATIFSFQAAVSWEVPNTVTCVTFASPMVGNLNFRKAFQGLEDTGDLRCLRVTNSLDLFTKLPDRSSWTLLNPLCCHTGPIQYFAFSCLFFACCQKSIYRHVGIGLKLYRHGRYKIKFSSDPDQYWLLVAKDWKKHIQKPLQLLATIPFSCCGSCLDCGCCCRMEDFGVNHQVKEHMTRLQQLEHDLNDKYLNDLYDMS